MLGSRYSGKAYAFSSHQRQGHTGENGESSRRGNTVDCGLTML